MTEEEAQALAHAITEAWAARPKAIREPGEEDCRRLAAALVAKGWSPPGQGKRDHQKKAAKARGREIGAKGTLTMIQVLSAYTALSKKLQDKPCSERTLTAVVDEIRRRFGKDVGRDAVKRHLRDFLRFGAQEDAEAARHEAGAGKLRS